MIDLRAQRGNKRGRHGPAWRSTRDIPSELYGHLSADRDGRVPCRRTANRQLSTLTRPEFEPSAVHACCAHYDAALNGSAVD